MNPPTGPNAPPPLAYRPYSGLSVASFVVGLVGFIAGIFPFAGFLGTVGLILGIVDMRSQKNTRVHGLSIAGMILGGLSTLGGIVWIIAVVGLSAAVKHGSCPHLYAFDGERYQLDADLASGALYKGAEREDSDRLESLRAVDGKYRVRLQNDLQEIDNIDSLALLVVDAPSNLDVLPTQSGGLVAVSHPTLPIHTTTTSSAERESWRLELARPANDPHATRAILVLRARNTQFAEDSFVEYMAKMGQGVRPLLELASSSKEGCACYHHYLEEEMARLGLPLLVSVSSATTPMTAAASSPSRAATSLAPTSTSTTSASTPLQYVVQPVGPATLRSQALAIDLPMGDGPIVVQLDATPRFWEIAQVELATEDSQALDIQVLTPRAADASTSASIPASAASGTDPKNGSDALTLVTATDDRRLVIKPNEYVDIQFDAPPPPPPGHTRTVVARLRGYYDLDIGGQEGVDMMQIFRHRFGLVSLPKFAQSRPSR